MARALLIFTLAALVSACGGGSSSTPGPPIRVTIPSGATVATVAESLSTRGIITSPKWFRLYARLTRQDRAIHAGVFELQPNSPVRQTIRILVSGRTAMDRLVVPEGLMLNEVVETVASQLSLAADSIWTAARDSSLRRQVGARGPTLEGYLYPSTYLVRVGARATAVVRQMVAEFETQWDERWNARLDSLDLSRDELVTLASIIEGEVRYPEDRWYVSSVYHNRLARRMRLQADPTVIYAIGRRRRLFERDYDVDSPYNTYVIRGLPPHPITQPSRRSIEAALYPRPSDFLYFVAGADGRHIFSRTFAEHRAAIRAIRHGGAP